MLTSRRQAALAQFGKGTGRFVESGYQARTGQPGARLPDCLATPQARAALGTATRAATITATRADILGWPLDLLVDRPDRALS